MSASTAATAASTEADEVTSRTTVSTFAPGPASDFRAARRSSFRPVAMTW
ncbi:MAG: hypothetical protein R3A52_06485 [Polyangiales bacterium]